MIRKHLTYEICQRKFGCVKGAYIMQYQVYDHHSDSKWSNWIFYGMLAVYRYVEAKCYTFLFNCFNCQSQ